MKFDNIHTANLFLVMHKIEVLPQTKTQKKNGTVVYKLPWKHMDNAGNSYDDTITLYKTGWVRQTSKFYHTPFKLHKDPIKTDIERVIFMANYIYKNYVGKHVYRVGGDSVQMIQERSRKPNKPDISLIVDGMRYRVF